MRKKFYTFAELSNYLSKLENNKKQRPDYEFWNKLYDEFVAWMQNNIDDDTIAELTVYHLKNAGEGLKKIYPKKMWDINPFLEMKDE